MKSVLYLFLFYFSLLISFSKADGLPSSEDIIKEGVEKLSKQIKENTYNSKHGLSYKNKYLIVLGDDTKWKRLRVERNTGIDPISQEDQAALDNELLNIGKIQGVDKQVIETYLVIINYLPVIVNEEIEADKVTAASILNNSVRDSPGTTASKEYDRVFNAIVDKVSNSNTTPTLFACLGNVYAFYQSEAKAKLKVGQLDFKYKNTDPKLKTILDLNCNAAIKNKTLGTSNAVRAQSMVAIIKAAVDEFRKKGTDIKCDQSFDQLLLATQAIKDAELQNAILQTAALIDSSSDANLGSNYIILDDAAKFNDVSTFTKEIMPDKLNMLAVDGNSNYRLYVVFQEVKFVLTDAERQNFAKQVFTSSTKAQNTTNAIFIIVPYYATWCQGNSFFGKVNKQTGMVMPAAYCKETSLTTNITVALAGYGNWEERFNKAYSFIRKKHVVYRYAINYKLSVIESKMDYQERVPGFDQIYELQIGIDDRYKQYAKLLTSRSNESKSVNYLGSTLIEQNLSGFQALEKAPEAWVSLNHGIREDALKLLTSDKQHSQVGREFVCWFVEENTVSTGLNLVTNKHLTPDSKYFVNGFNPEVLKKYYATLDNTGMLLGALDLDWITDGGGLILASIYKDRENQFVYGASLLIPIGSAIYLKTAKSFKNGNLFLKNGPDGWKFTRYEVGSFSDNLNRWADEIIDQKKLLSEDEFSILVDNFIKQSAQTQEAYSILKNIPEGNLKSFATDIADPTVADIFAKKPELVEAWKVLSVNETIRKNPGDLEKVSKYLKDNPAKFNEVSDGFAKAGDKRKWLDELGGAVKSIDDLVFSLKTSVSIKISKNAKYSLKLTDEELTQLAELGQELKLAEDEIEAFILAHSRRWKKEEVNDMLIIMRSIVEKSAKNNIGFKPEYNMLKAYKEAQLKMVEGGYLDPEVYLTESYINSHIQLFYNDASYFVNNEAYTDYIKGKPIVGIEADNSLFITTKKVADDVKSEAGQNLVKYEKLLGFSEGHFSKDKAVWRIDIINPQEFGIRVPSGNEIGANHWWHPGGYTSGGSIEAVTNRIPKEFNGKIIITERNLID